jgi:hypothetical protein
VKWTWMVCLILDAVLANAVISSLHEAGSTAKVLAVLAHSLIAVVILLSAWRVHFRVHPYEFAVQNFVEHFLFFSDVLLVLFGTLYTVLIHAFPTCAPPLGPAPGNWSRGDEWPNSTDLPSLDADGGGASTPSCMPTPVRALLEVVMMSLLLGAVLLAASFLVRAYCTGKMDVTQTQLDTQLDLRRVRGVSVLNLLQTFGNSGADSRKSRFFRFSERGDAGGAAVSGKRPRKPPKFSADAYLSAPVGPSIRMLTGLQRVDEDQEESAAADDMPIIISSPTALASYI